MCNWFYQSSDTCLISSSQLQWNSKFSIPQFFEPPDNSTQKTFPLDFLDSVEHCNFTLDLPNFWSLRQIFASLEGLRNWDSTIHSGITIPQTQNCRLPRRLFQYRILTFGHSRSPFKTICVSRSSVPSYPFKIFISYSAIHSHPYEIFHEPFSRSRLYFRNN